MAVNPKKKVVKKKPVGEKSVKKKTVTKKVKKKTPSPKTQAKKSSVKKSTKKKPPVDNLPSDGGIVIVEDDIIFDKAQDNEMRKAYLEEHRCDKMHQIAHHVLSPVHTYK